MDTTVKNTITATDRDAQYDAKAKSLLGTLLSKYLSVNEKLQIIGTEYDIPLEEDFRKDVSVMCNLSQGIMEEGERKGKTEVVMNMHNNGFTLKQIVLATKFSMDEVKKIIEKEEAELAFCAKL